MNQRRTHQISWSTGYIPATGDDRDKESCQGCLDDVLPMQTRADLKIVPSSTSALLFDMVITPTMNYASGTWTLSKEHERMIQSTQRKMLRLIIHTQVKYKTKTQGRNENKVMEVGKPDKEKDGEEEKENNGSSEDETDDGNSSTTDRDQDSDISFMNDTDEEIDTAEIEEEDWIEYIKRSTDEAMERMKTAKIQCWIKVHRRMKWRLAMRIARHWKKDG